MERNIALLIDFENIAAGCEKENLGKFDIDKVVARVKDRGRILIAKSYADWGRFARFKQQLLAANVTMYELTSHGMQDKNRADIAMVVDCLEIAYSRDYIDTFVLVSGDSDFTPLVLKLRELNKTVIGIGTRRSTSRLIINACDEFVFYENVVQKKVQVKAAAGGGLDARQAEAAQLVIDALGGMLQEDPTPPHASVLKSVILRRQPDFSETDLGYPSFTRFVEVLEKAGYLALSKDSKSGGWRVDLANGAGGAESSEAAPAPAGTAESDPYLPAGSEAVVRRLQGLGLGPTSAPARLALLEALVDFVGKRHRRVPPGLLADELPRRLRRTFPDVGGKTVKGVLKALLDAGKLIHKEGAVVRQPNVPFTVVDDVPTLNRAIAEVYLRALHGSGIDISDVAMLADLLFGDRGRTRDVEEILAWLSAPSDDDTFAEPAVRLDGDDLDSLLVTDDAPAPAVFDALDAALGAEEPRAAEPARDEGAARPKRPRRPRKPKAEPTTDDLDSVLEVED